MIGFTLGFYFARTFLKNILMVFLLFLFLITVVDLIELSRELSKAKTVSFKDIVLIALYRAPKFAENIFPFAVMFGAAGSLILLNKRLELVVARASGVSVWQFLTPFALTALFLGLFSALVYNPIAISGAANSRGVEADVFGKIKGSYASKTRSFWLRLNQKDGDLVLRSRVARKSGTELVSLSVYRFNPDGSALDRIEARRARYVERKNGQKLFVLSKAITTVPGKKGVPSKRLELPVDITREQLQARVTQASDIGFWQLSQKQAEAKSSGRNPLPFATQYHALLSQSLLLVAMVLLAATVSLRFARFGQSGKAILGGVLAGFVLYVLSRLVITFGSNGLVPPSIAAWSPALVASLIGATVLLYQEDG
jgi:lipopolysaccharide export system permease protein